jgi:hypothetical protein
MRFVASIATLAVEMNKWPSEIYQQYLRQPRDIELVMAVFEHRKKLEDREREKIEEEQRKVKLRHGS